MKSQYYFNSFQENKESEYAVSIDLSLEKEDYFKTAAQYKDTPVVPGSFQIEFAYEFLNSIHERNELYDFLLTDIQFLQAPKFIHNDLNLKLKAIRTGPHSFDLSITSDLKDKHGVIFSTIVHSRMKSKLLDKREPIELPFFDESVSYIDPDIPKVLYSKNSPLRLGKYFNCVGETLILNTSRRSIYKFSFPLMHKAFSAHLSPPLLVDAIMQNALTRVGFYIEVGIPKSIGQISIFKACNNDAALNRTYPELQLLCFKSEKTFHIERAYIVSLEGEIILQMANVHLTSLGYIDSRTGEFTQTLPM